MREEFGEKIADHPGVVARRKVLFVSMKKLMKNNGRGRKRLAKQKGRVCEKSAI